MGFWGSVGSFFDSVVDTVASGFEAVGNFVETVVNTVAEVAADVVETIGNAIQDGFNAVGDWLSETNEFLGEVFGWMGRIVAGAFNLAGAVIKGFLGIIGGVLGGFIKVVGGILTFNGSLIIQGLIDIGSSIVGGVIAILGVGISLVLQAVPVINKDRSLTQEEKDALTLVFRKSLSLYNIRIKSSAGIKKTFVFNNTIYTGIPDLAIPLHNLVHECVHVWQYQNLGTRYLAEALGAQAVYGRDECKPGIAYDWLKELSRGKTKWEYFNKEAAAQLIEEIWIDGEITMNKVGAKTITTETGNGVFYRKPLEPSNLNFELTQKFIASDDPPREPHPYDPSKEVWAHCPRDGKDYTQLAIDSVNTLRSKWNFRFSRFP